MKVIKIGAVWCPGCLVMRPRWQEIEDENPFLETQYLDYDQDTNLVKKYIKEEKVKLPQAIFVNKNGEEIDRLIGEASKKDLLAKIEEYKDR